ncbi:MAG: type VI secretion system tube protein Hcp [Rubrivivax sp.]|jgi:type VI secretion system secreted protein Hcp|nr:type VI secretion system tube protein Hcp [Rubrivivax sp.]
MAKADMFLKIEGKTTGPIKGESSAPEHPEEIEILEWSWSMSGSTGLGGAGARVRTALSEMRFGKETDRATTQLMSVMRNNELIKKAVLTVRKAGTLPPVEFLTITLSNARLTSLNIGTAAPGSPTLSEQFALAFEQIEVKYAPQRRAGDKGADLTFQAQVSSD